MRLMVIKEDSFNKYGQPGQFGFEAQNPGRNFLLITIRDNAETTPNLWLLHIPEDGPK